MLNWKRLLILALTVFLLSSSILVFAHAESYLPYVDLLAGGYSTYTNSSGSNISKSFNFNWSNNSNVSVSFPVNASGAFGQFELIIFTNDPNMRIFRNSLMQTAYNISTTNLGSSYIRVSGDFNGSLPGFYVDPSTASGWGYVVSGRAFLAGSTSSTVKFNVSSDVSYTGVPSFSESYPVQNAPLYSNSGSFRLSNFDGFEGFDYISLSLATSNLNISSISASTDSGLPLSVDYSCSFIDSDLNFIDPTDNSPYSQGRYNCNIVIDVRGVSIADGNLSLVINWNRAASEYNGYFAVTGAKASFYTVQSNALMGRLLEMLQEIRVGFSNLGDSLTDIYTDLKSWFDRDETPNDQLDQDLADQESQLGDISDSFESVTQPTVTDEQISIEQGVNNVSLTTITNWTTTIFGNSWFFTVFNMSMVFCLASLILFGKR